MEMDHHQYGGIPTDLRQLMTPKSSSVATRHFAAITQTPELFSNSQAGHYELLMLGAGHHQHHDLMPRGLHHELRSDSASGTVVGVNNIGGCGGGASSLSMSGLDGETASFGGCDVGNGRWPRQETLTLLEIRSRLDHKFKEANQKGPFWDEVSRIMSEEHGYQRSGKKCREKFENLYKYYKKTKEGKAGRQDGKHYRFFRQLEALYGDQAGNSNFIPDTHYSTINLGNNSLQFHNTSINNQDGYNPRSQYHEHHKVSESLSLSNSSEFDTSSSDDNANRVMDNDSAERRRKRRSSWRVKIKEFIDAQMRKLIERQESWLEKLTKTLELKEQERMVREEEWRKQESARIDREHKFWAKERAWIEARDATLMDTLQNLSGRSQLKSESSPLEFMAGTDQNQNDNGSETRNNVVVSQDHQNNWTEIEIRRLMELKSSMESRFHAACGTDEVLWEEISAKMASFGFDKSAINCKEKWDSISVYMSKSAENGKKRKETGYSPNPYSLYNQVGGYSGNCDSQGPEIVRLQVQANDGSSPSNSNINVNGAAVNVHDSCFRFMMADGENLWENYGLKLSKENQCTKISVMKFILRQDLIIHLCSRCLQD